MLCKRDSSPRLPQISWFFLLKLNPVKIIEIIALYVLFKKTTGTAGFQSSPFYNKEIWKFKENETMTTRFQRIATEILALYGWF